MKVMEAEAVGVVAAVAAVRAHVHVAALARLVVRAAVHHRHVPARAVQARDRVSFLF